MTFVPNLLVPGRTQTIATSVDPVKAGFRKSTCKQPYPTEEDAMSKGSQKNTEREIQ